MATFYIDYENVHNNGMLGVDHLDNNAYVIVFYSSNANTMNMETVKMFLDSKCGVEFVEADIGAPNALDFQLITFLYSGEIQDDFHYIITKDHGFDAAVKMGCRIGINNVKRFISISEALKHYEKLKEQSTSEQCAGLNQTLVNETYRDGIDCNIKEQIELLIRQAGNITLKDKELQETCAGIRDCDNKLNLYHYLRRKCGDRRGRLIYGALCDEFSQLKLNLAV